MKREINISFLYFLIGILSGAFYREFSKFNGYDGNTILSLVHVHLLTLGGLFFLIVAIFCKILDLYKNKNYIKFLILYNISLILTVSMMFLRGIFEILQIPINKSLNGMISGISGIGHIFIFVAFIMFYRIIIKEIK